MNASGTVTLEFNAQADGTSTIDGSLLNTSGMDIPELATLTSTINEFGDITGDCANVGAPLSTTGIELSGNSIVPALPDGETYIWEQTGFSVPLNDIVGNSIIMNLDAMTYGCCVLGKAEAAVSESFVNPD